MSWHLNQNMLINQFVRLINKHNQYLLYAFYLLQLCSNTIIKAEFNGSHFNGLLHDEFLTMVAGIDDFLQYLVPELDIQINHLLPGNTGCSLGEKLNFS